MISTAFKIVALVGISAAIFIEPASASRSEYIRCDATNVSCVRLHCDDQTGRCRRQNGYSDRYGDFSRAVYEGYFHGGTQWTCARGRCPRLPDPETGS